MMSPDTNLSPPPPRRTNDAFARSVAADVAAARTAAAPWRALLAVSVAAAAAVAIVVGSSGGPAVTHGGVAVAPVAPVVPQATAVDADVDEVVEEVGARLAFAADLDGDFAFAELDGSSEQELAAIEAALDKALRKL
jgi:hypothetical protein